MMPSEFTMETLPAPNDPRVTLSEVPPQKMAVIRFSGRWTEANYKEYTEKLMKWIEKEGLTITGERIIARYNPPFVPAFMRRNEIMIPVKE